MRMVPVHEAVGMVLCHDITRIVPHREKGRAFKKGHVIREEDIPALLDMGKEHIYVWEPAPGMVHEDEAAWHLARAAAGPGLCLEAPNQGKVSLRAEHDGLLKIDAARLYRVNSIGDICFATLHGNRAVSRGQVVAGTRVIPLAISGTALQEAEGICRTPAPLLSVQPFSPLWVGIITTGSEVYTGRVRDAFCGVLKRKLLPFGGRLLGQVIVPDDPDLITGEIRGMINEGAGLVLVTGGMSVDADDVTPMAIRATGAEVVNYGTPVLPGSMFMLAYLGHVPVCGLPGCVMFSRTTILDLLLPRIFAGERVERGELAALGYGGLCLECEVCRFPDCSFGKASPPAWPGI